MKADLRAQAMDDGRGWTLALISIVALIVWQALGEVYSFGEGGVYQPRDPVVIVDGTPIVDGVAASGTVEQTVGMMLVAAVLMAFGYFIGQARAQESGK